ncbi:hypothetical protein AAHA92_08416 [Salvia divinorum]|uniref:Uncharacterized protein n=1 Tax=Salvia divinorum TaxID=28513 RepID=A0ABD1HN69_SALDI
MDGAVRNEEILDFRCEAYGSFTQLWRDDIFLEMNRRFSIPVTKRRYAIRVLGRRNRVYPRVNYDSPSDDAFNLVTECVLATMRTMTPEEADSFSAQAVAEAEEAMIATEEAMREAEAAAAEAQAATAAFKKMKARKCCRKKACLEQERS